MAIQFPEDSPAGLRVVDPVPGVPVLPRRRIGSRRVHDAAVAALPSQSALIQSDGGFNCFVHEHRIHTGEFTHGSLTFPVQVYFAYEQPTLEQRALRGDNPNQALGIYDDVYFTEWRYQLEQFPNPDVTILHTEYDWAVFHSPYDYAVIRNLVDGQWVWSFFDDQIRVYRGGDSRYYLIRDDGASVNPKAWLCYDMQYPGNVTVLRHIRTVQRDSGGSEVWFSNPNGFQFEGASDGTASVNPYPEPYHPISQGNAAFLLFRAAYTDVYRENVSNSPWFYHNFDYLDITYSYDYFGHPLS